ncbi:hypothetical protein KIV56_00880 [Cryobacterium breve]|uniref:Site-specific integrase n=1 Tax=Cryobacterium breve TaxID=1259258 RepID=A0ABY7NCD5_9MICO|nr:hypothetical protein [Cryobacterium breve]WBM80175.1 hypothetical protein KIV56_00880 [Cryobacterium breve]
MRATLPETPHIRPLVISENGLVVTHTSENDAKSRVYDFSALADSSALALDLAAIMARKVRPTGQWRSLLTSKQGWESMKSFATFLADQELAQGGLSDVTSTMWRAWCLSLPDNTGGRRYARVLRSVLIDCAEIADSLRDLLSERSIKDVAVEQSYSDFDLNARSRAAREIFRAAEQRIEMNAKILNMHRSGHKWTNQNDKLLADALESIGRSGDVPVIFDSKNVRNVQYRYVRALGGEDCDHTWKRLFLDVGEAAALAFLIAECSGWNMTTISELNVPERVSTASDRVIHRVTLVKRRRSRPDVYETRNIESPDAKSLGRLLSRAAAATTPAREFLDSLGVHSDRLIISRVNRVLTPSDRASVVRFGISRTNQRAFKDATGLALNFRRIRKAVNTRSIRGPNQNTQATHDRVYVSPDRDAQKLWAGVIAAGVNAAITDAEHAVLATITKRNEERGRDTVTAACTDDTHSPFEEAGVACRASFLLCLACPNAIIMPKHRGRIAYLHQALRELRNVLDSATWQTQWLQHFNRLEHVRTQFCTDAEWKDALASVSALDAAVVNHLLRGRLEL